MVQRIKLIELPSLFLVLFVFFLVSGKYFSKPLENIYNQILEANKPKPVFNLNCTDYQQMIVVNGGKVCRDNSDIEMKIPVTGAISNFVNSASTSLMVNNSANSVSTDEFVKIFDTFPLQGDGKEIIYRFMDTGDIKIADENLINIYDIERYSPVTLGTPLTWTEDPYQDSYWRFLFYSLRPTNNLLYAYKTTGNPVYKDKLIEIINSFLETGMNQQIAWSDNHAVAFRTMVLINAWWKLREVNALPIDLSNKILLALQMHGNFLQDRKHYEPEYNHGINESAALYMLAINFPSLNGATSWLQIAQSRLTNSITDVVDQDGVLIENSPYYHFYALEKFWEIDRYSQKFDPSLSQIFDSKIEKMISYGAYILQPNQAVPLLGASLMRTVRNSGIEAEIANTHPYYKYVLTQGKEGVKPQSVSIHLPNAGQTIMRSGWKDDTKNSFVDQTQITFNIGAYRSLHSHYDALSFTLYANGTTLLPDSGLYTYDPGDYRNYFKGTRAHNTVVVDGKNQSEGDVSQGDYFEGAGYTYQSASHQLYNNVTHERAIVLIGKNLVLVLDKLNSDSSHTYEQMFHFAPGAKILMNGNDITATMGTANQSVTLFQLDNNGLNMHAAIGQSNPIDGVCSTEYHKLVPCYSMDYTKVGNNATFVTLLEIGKHNQQLTAKVNSTADEVTIFDGSKNYQIKLSETQNVKQVVTVNKGTIPPEPNQVIEDFHSAADWQVKQQDNSGGGMVMDDPSDHLFGSNSVSITSPTNGTWIEIYKDLNLNLSDKNLLFTMKLQNTNNVRTLEVGVSNDDWQNYATNIFNNGYHPENNDNWLNISIGKGFDRKTGGQWTIYGSQFDWLKITKIRFQNLILKKGHMVLRPGAASGCSVCSD